MFWRVCSKNKINVVSEFKSNSVNATNVSLMRSNLNKDLTKINMKQEKCSMSSNAKYIMVSHEISTHFLKTTNVFGKITCLLTTAVVKAEKEEEIILLNIMNYACHI